MEATPAFASGMQVTLSAAMAGIANSDCVDPSRTMVATSSLTNSPASPVIAMPASPRLGSFNACLKKATAEACAGVSTTVSRIDSTRQFAIKACTTGSRPAASVANDSRPSQIPRTSTPSGEFGNMHPALPSSRIARALSGQLSASMMLPGSASAHDTTFASDAGDKGCLDSALALDAQRAKVRRSPLSETVIWLTDLQAPVPPSLISHPPTDHRTEAPDS